MKVYLKNHDSFEIVVAFVRGQGQEMSVIINDSAAGGTRLVGNDTSFRAAASMLEFAVPIFPIQKYLADGPFDTEICVANADDNGWVNSQSTDSRMIDFVN
jgi:hypothetical protein